MDVQESSNLSTLEDVPLLTAVDLSYSYDGSRLVLTNVSLEVRRREVLAIAGPNGSGKTTLVKHLNGLIKPTTGKIYYLEKEIRNPKDLMKRVGLVFQNPDDQVFFPIVEEDVAFGPKNMGLSPSEIQERVAYALNSMQILPLRNRSYYTLSFGERKKVAIAGVLAMKPEIIILDEPTIGLDPWSKKSFIDLINRLREDTTIILVAHDLDLLKISDRILFLKEGRILGEYHDFEIFRQQAIGEK